jgi:formylglycine-generating enzyme required for sulfatase activity
LHGQQAIDVNAPLTHVSFYEADAFARWRAETYGDESVRLPREFEWEQAARASGEMQQMHRVLWQWTQSYYEPYPGYRPLPGALAEYNGKFFDNQRVLRGGSQATPENHYRITYRNFWSAHTRFQFTGIRLARDIT